MASGTASFVEFYARGHRRYEWWFIPLAILINYGVVQMLRYATILEFAIIFGVIGGTLRIVSTLVLHDHVSTGARVGYGFLLAAVAAKYIIK